MIQYYHMSILRRKYWWRAVLTSKITLALVLVACLALSFSVYDRYVIERKMAERRVQKEQELQALEVRKNELEEKVEYLKDDRGVESEVRRHFDVAREGEQVIVLVESESKTKNFSSTSFSTKVEKEEGGFWDWLLFWR